MEGAGVREVRGAELWLDVALAGLLALLLLPASLLALTQGEVPALWEVAVAGALVTMHAAVLARRLRPEQSFVVVSLTMLVLAVAPDLGGPTAAEAGGPFAPLLLPSSLLFFVSLYAVSALGRTPWPRLGLAVGVVGGALSVVRLWDAADYSIPATGALPWRLMVVSLVVAGVLAAWGLGRFRATRLAFVDQLAERAARAERQRIAREMHDVVAHSLAVVVGYAEGGRMLVTKDPGRAPEVLDTIASTGREALTEMRSLLGVLREGGRGDMTTVPQPGLADLTALADQVRAAGTAVTLTSTGSEGELSATGDLAAYRVVQEALTNVRKHAGPDARARVELAWETRVLVITVSDDGKDRPAAGGAGRGLLGMRERLELVGGTLEEAGEVASGGFRVRARIPLAQKGSRR